MPRGFEELDPAQLGTGGTPAYQAPEVLRRKHVGRKLDLYGFAVTLWEMYTTKLPWSDCNLEQMTVRVAGRSVQPMCA
jgi:serine/threonine protein kinase